MPIEIAPAMSSATPPRTTSLDFPSDERPAVRANGTVRPSERPITLIRAETQGNKLALLFSKELSKSVEGAVTPAGLSGDAFALQEHGGRNAYTSRTMSGFIN